ncbi:MAG: hypothetical protein COA57_03300 [Flavobacteriales bacterium]|nr:MAG: hypothetical protein COA57_03300 [Flavobacteriales bacterium]
MKQFNSLTIQLLVYFLVILCLHSTLSAQINPQNITIARDKWGVPHIFSKTDAEASYGLAWANAEDAFELMQQQLAASKFVMGKWIGKNGAAADFFAQFINAEKLVTEHWDELTPEYIRYLEGYCQAVNDFAEKYPKRVKVKGIFPITPKDVVHTYVVTFSFITGIAGTVQNILNGDVDKHELRLGSNAYAFSSAKSTDGKTYLCANPHFQLEGPLTFYEAHIQSEEGLNMLGAIFQGGTSIFIGSNEHLGWGMTWNFYDRVDVYKLKMHPKEKLKYEFDGKWLDLKERPIKLKVKMLGFLTIPAKKMTYESIYGPTLKSKGNNFYSVRGPSMLNIGAGQQYYYMNKAQNFEDFEKTLRMNKISMFNIVYADKEDNIFYMTNGIIPIRDMSFEWDSVIPGNTSKTLWKEYYPIDSLPQVKNPSCGYIFNTNNTPLNATCKGENDTIYLPRHWLDARPGDNNRSERFMELVNEKDKFSYEEFKAMKFDNQMPQKSYFLKSIQPLYDINPDNYPDIAPVIRKIHGWNKKADFENTDASLFLVTFSYIFEKFEIANNDPFISGIDADEKLYVEAIRFAKKKLLKHFGTTEVALGDLQRFERNGTDYPGPGYADMLRAGWSIPWKKGRHKLVYGDTYIHYVKFSKNGAEEIETLLPFSTLPSMQKYEDQLPIYNKQQTKKMTLDKEEILKNAIKIYNPG